MAKKKAPPKRATVESALPEAYALIACDSIETSTSIGSKPTLRGAFDVIVVPGPDEPARPFSLFTKLFGGSGKHSIGLDLVSPSGKSVSLGEPQIVELEANQVVQGVSVVGAILFPEEGVWKVYNVVDGNRIGSPCVLIVKHPKVAK